MRSAVRLSFLLILAFGLAACANLSGEPPIMATILPATMIPPTEVPPEDIGFPAFPPDLANGAYLYAANCAACHGDTGRGDGPVALANPAMVARDFTNPTRARNQTPRQWFDMITEGNIENLMPPWGNTLTEQERWDVAMYTYTMHYTGDMLASGERIYAACAECHGDTGAGDGPEAATSPVDVKALTNQRAMSTLSDAMIYEMITKGFDGVMPSYEDLSEADRRAVVAYARTLSLDMDELGPLPTSTPLPPVSGALADLAGGAMLLQIHAIGEGLEVVQALSLTNSGSLPFSQNITLPTGEYAALVLNLPDGALLISSTSGVAASADGATVYISEPIPAQSENLYVLNYILPYTAGQPVSVPVDVPVNGPVRILVRPLEMAIHSNDLPPLGEQLIGEYTYNAYGGDLALTAGAALRFTMTGTPDEAATVAPASTPTPATVTLSGVVTSDVLVPLLGLAVLLLVIAVAAYAYRAHATSPQARIMKIAREIGILDAAHEAGTLNHDLWHQQRAALKAEQLRLRGLAGDDEE